MKLTQRIDRRLTFVVDVAVFVLLLAATGLGWFASLLIAEGVSWLVRLVWLSPALLQFILRRLVSIVPILLIVIALGFILVELAPGDAFSQLDVTPGIDPAFVDRIRDQFGVGQPWHERFFRYIWNAVRGDFGYSATYRTPVFALVSQRATNTLLLAVTALVFAWGISIPLGVIAATKQYKWQDQALSVVAFVGLAIPNFFLAFLLIYLIATTGIPLPLGGMRSLDSNLFGPLRAALDIARHMIVPVFVLGTSAMASLTRVMRANMLDVLGQQYVVTARSKGQTERKVVYRHALRNAINPMITILGFQLGAIMSGTPLVEAVLAWPGLGQLILQALLSQDTYLVVGSLIYGVILLMLGNLVADIMLALADPRIRIS
ncbi:MAG: ABC transporter permease [Spirochaetota bacterium]